MTEMRHRRPEQVRAWLQRQPSLDELCEAYPAEWERVRRELSALVAAEDPAAIERYIAGLAAVKPGRSAGARASEAERLAAQVRRQMAAAALRRHALAFATGVERGQVRFNLVNGWLAQRLLFARGLERKPVSLTRFRLLWPLIWQRRRLLPLVQPKGIYCFYSGALIAALAARIGERPCLEIGAGDGTLSRFLTARGVDVTATDDHSWSHAISYPDSVIRQDAREALRRRHPQVVICSWPPAVNDFERHVFRTESVELYLVIGSRHEFAAGDWDAYRAQEAFELRRAPELSRLVLPPELDPEVYVFERARGSGAPAP